MSRAAARWLVAAVVGVTAAMEVMAVSLAAGVAPLGQPILYAVYGIVQAVAAAIIVGAIRATRSVGCSPHSGSSTRCARTSPCHTGSGGTFTGGRGRRMPVGRERGECAYDVLVADDGSMSR